jgi:hypothetical protein
MRKTLFMIAVLISAVQLQAQIAVVNYMKVKPGADDAFVASIDVFQKATAGLKPEQLLEMTSLIDNTDEIREMIRTQLWEVIDVTTPKK